ncbi:MAG: hypothetical protein ACNA8W_06325 [Bradymonadaceae bacterium]
MGTPGELRGVMLFPVELDALGWWLAGLFAALLILGWLLGRLRRGRRRRVIRARQGRAQVGEDEASSFLGEWGFEVVDSQVRHHWSVLVDGEAEEILLIADYLVEREGLRYVAEVKTGLDAPSIRTAATRRQLLEYRCAFDVDGVLLVDMEGETIQEIVFELSN